MRRLIPAVIVSVLLPFAALAQTADEYGKNAAFTIRKLDKPFDVSDRAKLVLSPTTALALGFKYEYQSTDGDHDNVEWVIIRNPQNHLIPEGKIIAVEAVKQGLYGDYLDEMSGPGQTTHRVDTDSDGRPDAFYLDLARDGLVDRVGLLGPSY